MAYLLFQHQTATSQATGLVSAESSSLKTPNSFDQAERSVILLSRNDPWLSLADPLRAFSTAPESIGIPLLFLI